MLLDCHIWHVRNLEYFELDDLRPMNLIIGPNGSGKTSILEAIHFLSVGRSFRTHLYKKVIQINSDELIVQASLVDSKKVGLRKKQDGTLTIRIDGETKQSIIDNSLLLPVQVIDPSAFSLLQSGPEARRKFFDWGVCQYDPGFYTFWKNYQRLLKQRNAAIRGQLSIDMVTVWDEQLVEMAHAIDASRQAYLNSFSPLFEKYFDILLSDLDIEYHYYPGWNQGDGFEAVLKNNIYRDIESGYTLSGVHRFDIKLKTNSNKFVADIFSRGQQKLVVIAMKLAQAALCAQQKKVVFLLDDIAAELDSNRREQLADLLSELNCQYFITGVEQSLLEPFEAISHSYTRLS